jgi:hypothetical protein
MFDITQLGLNVGVVLGILAITQVIKNIDTKNKYKRFYVLIPLALSFLAGFAVTKPLEFQDFLNNVLMYVGGSVYLYSTKSIFKKEKNVKQP